uniref:Regulator of G protein signaling 14 n=1 Tax=Bubo bubo TaxID=30461 RepID=A0A8C0FNU9_BUBBB
MSCFGQKEKGGEPGKAAACCLLCSRWLCRKSPVSIPLLSLANDPLLPGAHPPKVQKLGLPLGTSISLMEGLHLNAWSPSLSPREGFPREFLKKEFSAENVYFWQACERFQQIPLAQEARRIYDEFLSSHSVSPVNIDKQAWIGEDMLATPMLHPTRVLSRHILPLQIFNLMKFDSYTRFVKSPLYQACLRAESQGQPLPDLRPHSRSSSPPPDLNKVSRVGRGARGPVPSPEKTVLGPFPVAWSKPSPRMRTEERSGD